MDSLENIAALATGFQHSEVGIIRFSGETVRAVLAPYISTDEFKTRIYTPCHFSPCDGVSYPAGFVYFKAPFSYTGEDVLELHLPGNPVLLDDVCRELFKDDISPAPPGEFTKRAFLNNKMDLTQARSVMQLIQSTDETQRRHALTMLEGGTSERLQEVAETLVSVLGLLQASLEFSPDEIGSIDPAEIIQLLLNAIELFKKASPSEGSERTSSFTRVLITGASNTGKSSLFNAFCEKRRSFVSPEAHATRDSIEAVLSLAGNEVCVVDSCGTHLAEDGFKYALQKQYKRLVEQSDIIIVCFDARHESNAEELAYFNAITLPKLAVFTHADIASVGFDLYNDTACKVALHTGEGLPVIIDELQKKVASLQGSSLGAQWHSTHADIEERLDQAYHILEMGEPEEFAVTFLEEAKDLLDGLRGSEVSDDILDGVFKRFCVGK